MPYRFLEDVATSDIAFEATGRGLAEMFRSAADATLRVMVEEPETVEGTETVEIRLDDESLEFLLFNFLQELIWYKDAKKLLLRADVISITKRDGRWSIEAHASGEPIDQERHPMVVDVKAVTMHMFGVEETPNGWKCTVVLDI
jgi:SHS2 domain-containing protein